MGAKAIKETDHNERDSSCGFVEIDEKKAVKSKKMNAALLMMFGVFFVTLQVIATANRAEVRAKRNGTEDAIMAKSDVLTRQRRGDISWECTGKCAAYWVCIVKGVFTSESCDYPSGCECKCFATQKC